MEFLKIYETNNNDDKTAMTLVNIGIVYKTQKEYKKAVKTAPRYRQSAEDDFREYLNESITLEEWIDNDFENRLEQQIIYSEGVIDRMNYKGDYAINYYSRATFNGKELMHVMYFQGEKENWRKGNYKVPQSKLTEWYYR